MFISGHISNHHVSPGVGAVRMLHTCPQQHAQHKLECSVLSDRHNGQTPPSHIDVLGRQFVLLCAGCILSYIVHLPRGNYPCNLAGKNPEEVLTDLDTGSYVFSESR